MMLLIVCGCDKEKEQLQQDDNSNYTMVQYYLAEEVISIATNEFKNPSSVRIITTGKAKYENVGRSLGATSDLYRFTEFYLGLTGENSFGGVDKACYRIYETQNYGENGYNISSSTGLERLDFNECNNNVDLFFKDYEKEIHNLESINNQNFVYGSFTEEDMKVANHYIKNYWEQLGY